MHDSQGVVKRKVDVPVLSESGATLEMNTFVTPGKRCFELLRASKFAPETLRK